VTIAAYTEQAWNVSLLEDTYEDGVLKNSVLLETRWGTIETVRRLVDDALEDVFEAEALRVHGQAAGGPPEPGSPPA
jgi:hypothetical protein